MLRPGFAKQHTCPADCETNERWCGYIFGILVVTIKEDRNLNSSAQNEILTSASVILAVGITKEYHPLLFQGTHTHDSANFS